MQRSKSLQYGRIFPTTSELPAAIQLGPLANCDIGPKSTPRQNWRGEPCTAARFVASTDQIMRKL